MAKMNFALFDPTGEAWSSGASSRGKMMRGGETLTPSLGCEVTRGMGNPTSTIHLASISTGFSKGQRGPKGTMGLHWSKDFYGTIEKSHLEMYRK